MFRSFSTRKLATRLSIATALSTTATKKMSSVRSFATTTPVWAEAETLAKKFGKCDMFCMQCEQTYKGKGCFRVGVCGKTPRVAAMQDLTVHALKILGFYCHGIRTLGGQVPAEANHLTLFSLFSTLTNVNFDESRFVTILSDIKNATDAVAKIYAGLKGTEKPNTNVFLPNDCSKADALVETGRLVGVLSRFQVPGEQNGAGVAEMLVYGLKGLAAYSDHSLMNNVENQEIYAYIHKALAFLVGPTPSDLGKALELCMECGKVNVTAMGQLYDSNKSLGVPTPTAAPIKPVPGKCILVSGHDLIIVKGLLERCEKEGINVFTHGELLPAHSYPELKKYKSLAGHFGGAWMRQSIEFPHFPGAILMTTNCLTEPQEQYKESLFTAGAVGWSNVKHIGDNMSDIQFDSLIAAAKAAPGFTEKDTAFTYPDPEGTTRPESYMVGFGHETVLSVAPTIIEQIQKGNITRFFVVGGCDGFEGERSYYTDLVKNLPPTAVILTLGCGKFRVNHLDLGTIGDTGIPRVLDMGQCNDSFSAIQVALALADVLKCKVSDLPLSIVLSWFEQKAVAVLLSCLQLGLKPIHIGPTLPAFITPDVLQVLVKDFGVVPIGDPEKDAKTMCAATGAS